MSWRRLSFVRQAFHKVFLGVLLLTAWQGVSATRIVFVGDSITGLSRNASYGFANQLEATFKAEKPGGDYEIISLGGSGQSVSSWLGIEKRSRAQPVHLDVKTLDVKEELSRPADIMVVMLGMNDVLAPYVNGSDAALDRWVEHYRSLIHALRERAGPGRFAICSITPCTEDLSGPKNLLIDQMNSRIRDLAEAEGLEYFATAESVRDVLSRGRKVKPDFHVTTDFVHPNRAGHLAIAQAMLRGIEKGEDNVGQSLRQQLDALLEEASQAAGGLSWEIESIKPESDGVFSFTIRYYWKSAEDSVAPQMSLTVPEGWRVTPEATAGVEGTFNITGRPEQLENRLVLSGKSGEDNRRAEITLPAPWLVAAGLILPHWSRDGFDHEAAITPIDWIIEAGENFVGDVEVGKGLKLTWQPLFSSVDYTGGDHPDSVDFAAITHAATFEAGYAVRQIRSERQREVMLEIGSRRFAGECHLTVWLNGELLYNDRTAKTEVPARLVEGQNTLVFKASHRTWQWQVSVGVRGVDGDSLADLRYSLPELE